MPIEGIDINSLIVSIQLFSMSDYLLVFRNDKEQLFLVEATRAFWNHLFYCDNYEKSKFLNHSLREFLGSSLIVRTFCAYYDIV